jgi:hypothetical protein
MCQCAYFFGIERGAGVRVTGIRFFLSWLAPFPKGVSVEDGRGFASRKEREKKPFLSQKTPEIFAISAFSAVNFSIVIPRVVAESMQYLDSATLLRFAQNDDDFSSRLRVSA